MSGIFLDDRFESDFKPFIAAELQALTAYDATRPAGHVYDFPSHVRRVASDMKALSLALGHDEEMAGALYWASLIHDSGKRLLPVSIWDGADKPSETVKKQRRQHTMLGVSILNDRFGTDDRHPFLDVARDLMAHHHESMDGAGWLGLRGPQLSLHARMLCVCDAFDGYSVWRPHFGPRDLTPAGVLHRMGIEKKGQFDPDILTCFATLKTGAS